MTPPRKWVKLPNTWIERGGLRDFKWTKGEGADHLAALMVLTVVSHYAHPDTGISRLTYDQICVATTLSRAKVSAGIKKLEKLSLIEREPDGRSTYKLIDYDPDLGWAMFPAKGLYRNGTIAAFEEFRLRLRSELDALKLYFLFASRRDRRTNAAFLTYEKITEYSGVQRNNIRTALSFLAANALVHLDQVPSNANEGLANKYRLTTLESYRHRGTIGRNEALADFEDDIEPAIDTVSLD